jgi:redox-sensitive bicupin YhaK (pirin superfamily)
MTMQKVIHRAETRGHFDHGWLNTYHSFSFADYYNPDRIQFGLLRVLNDDIVQPGMGFGTHPHNNMEIITIPLEGQLEHRDSMGNGSVIEAGEVQVMTAGSGITHSEFNPSQEEVVNLLQIWVFPRERNLTPRYDQKRFDTSKMKNRWLTVVTPDGADESLLIHQDAWFSLAETGAGREMNYRLHSDNSGVYLFVIDGEVEVDGDTLKSRDGMGMYDVPEFAVESQQPAKFLVMEIPMS